MSKRPIGTHFEKLLSSQARLGALLPIDSILQQSIFIGSAFVGVQWPIGTHFGKLL
jgi:hypothetical protein